MPTNGWAQVICAPTPLSWGLTVSMATTVRSVTVQPLAGLVTVTE